MVVLIFLTQVKYSSLRKVIFQCQHVCLCSCARNCVVLLMPRKYHRYLLHEHELLHHVQRCVSVVQLFHSGNHHHLPAQHRTIRSAVHILISSVTDQCTAVTPAVDRNSCYGRVMWLLGTHFVASPATRYQLLVMTLQSAAMGMSASLELISLRKVQCLSHLVRVRPHRSQTVALPTQF